MGKQRNTGHISAQHGVQCSDPVYCCLGLLKDSTCYLTRSAVGPLREFRGHELQSWADAALCGCASLGSYATTSHCSADVP